MDFQRKNKSNKKKNQYSPKVVYISTPMKVKTTASKFRSLVQELTGRDSDITRSMEVVEVHNCSFHDAADDVLRTNTSEMSKSATWYDGHQVFATSLHQTHHDDHQVFTASPDQTHYEDHQVFATSPDQTWDSSTSSESYVDQFLVEEQYLQDVLSSSLLLV